MMVSYITTLCKPPGGNLPAFCAHVLSVIDYFLFFNGTTARKSVPEARVDLGVGLIL